MSNSCPFPLLLRNKALKYRQNLEKQRDRERRSSRGQRSKNRQKDEKALGVLRVKGGRLIEEYVGAGTRGPWSSGNEKTWWRKGDQDGTLSLGSRWIVWELWTDGGCDGNRMSGAVWWKPLQTRSLSTGLHFHYCLKEDCAVDSFCFLGDLWAHAWRGAAPSLPSALSEEAESARALGECSRVSTVKLWLDLVKS